MTSQTSGDDGNTLRVLLAEDNELNRKVMVAFLDHLGYDATVAVNGQDALDAALDAEFDVVLIDIQLPGLNGLDLVKELRAQIEAAPHLVAVTAMARSDGDRFYRDHGFDAYLGKPVSIDELRRVLSPLEPRRH